MRIVAIAGSLRAGSFNKKLLAVAVAAARDEGLDIDLVDLRALALPLYDGDLEAASGLPAGAVELRERIGAARGLLIASPEYNWSIPGTFKNAIDWVSRPPAQPLAGKVAALMSASPGGFGGVRGLAHLRQTMQALDVWVLPSQVTVSAADKAFTPEGGLVDARIDGQVKALVKSLADMCRRLG